MILGALALKVISEMLWWRSAEKVKVEGFRDREVKYIPCKKVKEIPLRSAGE